MKTVTAADANRQFSALLRRVTQGEQIVITTRGKPVATLAPLAPVRDAGTRCGSHAPARAPEVAARQRAGAQLDARRTV